LVIVVAVVNIEIVVLVKVKMVLVKELSELGQVIEVQSILLMHPFATTFVLSWKHYRKRQMRRWIV